MTDAAWPALGIEDVRQRLAAMQAGDLPTHGGRTLAYVYDSGLADVDALARDAVAGHAHSNGLDPTAFPSLQQMENDLIGRAGALLDAPDGCAGSVTSGGTESVLLAVLAARDSRPDITAPELVLPTTAHAAFHKAAHYFGLTLVLVDVDPHTFRADPDAVASALTDQTVLVVASAPSYAHGVVDPVPAIAAAAAARGVRCHVDACIGGWVLPFLDDVPYPWTFAVDGVTSISVDLHKYAYAPKGTSLLLHRSAELRASQLFASAAWPGYTMLNATMQSTRSGGPVAGAWAAVSAIGSTGYARLAAQARAGTLALAAGIGATFDAGIPHVRVLVPPDSTLLALGTDESCDVYTLTDAMQARGWYVQPQLPFAQGDATLPATIHLTMSAATEPSIPDFLAALTHAVEEARAAGPVEVDAELAHLLAHLDPDTLDAQTFAAVLGAAGLASGTGGIVLPDAMAPVNALLEVAPPRLRERLLLGVLDALSRPGPQVRSERDPAPPAAPDHHSFG